MSFLEIKSRSDYGKLVEVFTSYFYNTKLQGDELAIDIGANAGMHTTNLSRKLKNGKVIAVEPIPHLYEKLKNLGLKNTQIINAVVSPSREMVEFEINENNYALSRIIPTNKATINQLETQESSPKSKCTVKSVRLDELEYEKKLSFIKCDTEGFDFLALKTGEKIIKKYRPFLVFENGRNWNAVEYGYDKEDFFDFFYSIGYMVYDIHGSPLVPENWFSKNISFEFISFPREINHFEILQSINSFWKVAHKLNEVDDWGLCAKLGEQASKWVL